MLTRRHLILKGLLLAGNQTHFHVHDISGRQTR
jgi:hypothetical protein